MAIRTHDLFKVLGHPDRLRVLREVLDRGSAGTHELAAHLQLAKPAVSQALTALAREGLVVRGRERTPYSVPRPREVRALLAAALLVEHFNTGSPAALSLARDLKRQDMAAALTNRSRP